MEERRIFEDEGLLIKEAEMKIKDVMTKDVMTTTPDSTIQEVGQILRQKRISGLPVMDGETMVGIITTTDIMKYILDNIYQVKVAEESYPELKISDLVESAKLQVKIKKIMTRNVATLNEEDTIQEVMRLMFVKEIHTIPIVRDGKLTGIVGRRDLVQIL